MPDKGDGFTFIDGKGDIIKNLVFSVIREGHMFKTDISFSNLRLSIFLDRFIVGLIDQCKDTTC